MQVGKCIVYKFQNIMQEGKKSAKVITIKPTSQGLENYEHPFDQKESVQKIKQSIVAHYSVQYEQIKLIFKGKILNDRQTAGEANLENSVVMLVINKKSQPPKKNTSDQTIPRIPSSFSTGMGGTMPVGFGGYSMINHPQYMSAMSGAVNEEKIDQVLNDPMYMGMMQEMMQDPDTLKYLIDQNPMLKGMFNSNPSMKMILENPQLMKAVFNPQTLKLTRQFMKNQQNGTLPNVPNLQGQGNGPVLNNGLGGFSGQGPAYSGFQQQLNPNSQIPMMPGYNPFMMGLNQPSLLNNQNNLFQQLFNQRLSQASQGQMGVSTSNEISIEQKYKNQLKQLESLGFKDREQNIKALIESKGDVDGAIERLCQD